ncbi:MAG: tRNA1(Val) (adenine(37)-N6)-methyltransferase [Desulfobulbaceae bacterium]|nr:tRNA1(Val) (adenine(37)-N6)-methyltransferase [Desulfobulbaceae bacterium]
MVEVPTRELTNDNLFAGRLLCRQHRHGYRFAVDAVLLAHFFTPKSDENILDLGCGCGVISLVLAYRHPYLHLTGLELQPQLAVLARRNVADNGLAERITIVEGDLRASGGLFKPGQFQRLVCNPPYYRAAAARLNADPERRLARHEVAAPLDEVVVAASGLLQQGGHVDLVYPAERAATLLAALRGVGLEPKRLQVVYPYPGSAGRLVLVEALKGGGEELEILPPFYLCKEQGGEYSWEMARCYAP